LNGLNGLNVAERLNCVNQLPVGFGSLAKVLKPPSLLKEVKDDLGKSLNSYAKL
jgi:predicted DNA-binding transcriptional regulator YafY